MFKKIIKFAAVSAAVAAMASCAASNAPATTETASQAENTAVTDASDFVSLAEAVPDVILEIRYYSTYNFVGDRIDGYEEPCALITKDAAAALMKELEIMQGDENGDMMLDKKVSRAEFAKIAIGLKSTTRTDRRQPLKTLSIGLKIQAKRA